MNREDTFDLEKEKRKGEVAVTLRLMNPGLSSCHRCGLPWNECENKSIMSELDRSIFAMCTYCWDNSDVEERLHHYKSVWYEHRNRWNHHYDWSVVEQNILLESNKKDERSY